MQPMQTTEALQKTEASAARGLERLPIFPLPLTPLERFLYQSDTPQSSMVIRVLLRFTGEYRAELLTDTLRRAIARHPFMSCRLAGSGSRLQWIDGTPEKIVAHQVAGSVFEPECGPLAKRIDLRRSAGLHVEIRLMDDGIKVIMDGHHAVTDGNGIRQIITDWMHLYHCEVNGTPSKLPVMDPDRLQQRHKFPQPAAVAPVTFREAVRNFFVTVRGRTARWTGRNDQRQAESASVHSYMVEEILTLEQSERLQERLTAWKVTLNDVMIVSCMATFARLAPAGSSKHRVTILNPTDLRLPSDRSLPATNRFGFAFVRRKRGECADPSKLLPGVHDEMKYVRDGYIGVEFIKGLDTASRIPGGVDFFRRLGLFLPSLQWTCLGDVTRGAKRLMVWKDGSIYAGGLKLESATGFAPFAENVPLSVATCEAGKRVTLTVRSAVQRMTFEQTREFAVALVNQICSLELPEQA